MGGGSIYTQVNFEDLEEEQQEKIVKTLDKYKPYRRTVYAYKYDTHEFIGKFDSVMKASIYTNTRRPDISSMINNPNVRSCNGYIFSLTPINDFSSYIRQTNEKKQVVYIYKDATLYKKVDSRSQAAEITGISMKDIYSAVKRNSLTSIQGYNFFDHELEEDKRKRIRNDRYADMRRTYHCYDDTGKLGLDSTCFATGVEIAYLCCVLNSPMGHFLLKDAPKTGTGDLLISVQAVEPIKVPELEDSSVFATYLQRYTDGDAEVEKEINAQIYTLYNLSQEEIEYIENTFI